MPDRSMMRRLAPVCVLAAFPLLLVLQALATRSTLFYDDIRWIFYPWKAALSNNPYSLWEPWEFGGLPRFANVELELYYPPNLLYEMLPTAYAMVVFIAAHLALAAVFTYRWLRLLSLSRAAACVGALAFSLSSQMVLHTGQVTVLAQSAWLPAGLLAIERLARRPSAREAALGGLYLFFALSAGHPQYLYISLCLWTAYALWRRPSWRWTALALGLGGLLELPQLLAELELYGQAMRGRGEPFDFVTMLSWPMYRWWGLLAPYAHGNPAVVFDWHYNFHEITLYVGVVTLLLAAVGVTGLTSQPPVRFWCIVVVAALGLALGSNTPLYAVAFRCLPGLAIFRVPARWLLLVCCGLAVLAAFGLDRLRTTQSRSTVCLVVAGLAVLFGLGWIGAHDGDGKEVAIAAALTLSGALSCIAVGLGYRRTGSLLVVALLLLDLASFAVRYIRYVPVGEVEALAAAPFPAPTGRGLTTANPSPNGIATHFASVWHLRSIQGYHAEMLQETVDYVFYAVYGRPMDEEQRLAMLHHDGYLIFGPVHNPMLRMLDLQWQILTQGRRLELSPVAGGFGAAWVVAESRAMPREAQLEALSQEQVDPRRIVLFEKPQPATDPHADGQVTLSSRSADRLTYTADMSGDAWVVTSEVWYPGWQATVDGKATPVLRGDGLLRTIRVPPGHHEIVIAYRPFWRFAFSISGLTLLIVLGILWRGERW